MNLYDISEDIISILNQEEWTDETESQLESLNLALEVKAGNIVKFSANLDTFIDGCDAEIKRLQDRKKAATNRKASLLSYLKRNMEAIERTELEAGTHTLKLQKNPPRVVIDDEQKVPAKFFVVVPAQTQLDKKELAKELKNGEVEGAHLEHSTRLVIK